MTRNSYSTYLFSTPSFLEGVARLIDVGGLLNQYNKSSSPAAADARALRSDWQSMVLDIRVVMEHVDAQLLEEEDAYRRAELEEIRSILSRVRERYVSEIAHGGGR